MLEFSSNCYAVRKLENETMIPAVKLGMATKIKDTNDVNIKDLYTKDERDIQNNGFGLSIYKINIMTAPVYEDWTTVIRFWYDKRIDRAGVKIPVSGLSAILQTITIAQVLKAKNIQVNKDGYKISLKRVTQVLNQLFNAEFTVAEKK